MRKVSSGLTKLIAGTALLFSLSGCAGMGLRDDVEDGPKIGDLQSNLLMEIPVPFSISVDILATSSKTKVREIAFLDDDGKPIYASYDQICPNHDKPVSTALYDGLRNQIYVFSHPNLDNPQENFKDRYIERIIPYSVDVTTDDLIFDCEKKWL